MVTIHMFRQSDNYNLKYRIVSTIYPFPIEIDFFKEYNVSYKKTNVHLVRTQRSLSCYVERSN